VASTDSGSNTQIDSSIGDDALSQALFAHDVLEYGSVEQAEKMRQVWGHEQYKAQISQFVDQQHGALFAADLNDSAVDLISQEFVKDGKGDADIAIYEFSDLGCGYCQRQHEQKTMDEVIAGA